MKILLNRCYGGFDLSDEAYKLYAKKKGYNLYEYELDFKRELYKYYNNKFFKSFFTKDFGNNVKISDEDYKKYHLYLDENYRIDSTLIEVVEELGYKASMQFSDIKVVEIPDNSFYIIDDYDGVETIYYSESEIKEI